jgi:nucleoside-diphosphate-sugar epimerase
MKNKKILITGGAGFIGSHLVESFLKMNCKKIVILDNL